MTNNDKYIAWLESDTGIYALRGIIEEARGNIEKFRELFVQRFRFDPTIADRPKVNGMIYIKIN